MIKPLVVIAALILTVGPVYADDKAVCTRWADTMIGMVELAETQHANGTTLIDYRAGIQDIADNANDDVTRAEVAKFQAMNGPVVVWSMLYGDDLDNWNKVYAICMGEQHD
jgi:hypothetical protein